MDVVIRIQNEPFDPAAELKPLAGAGAIASFIGSVRAEPGLVGLRLEHYPGMTEREIARQVDGAAARWPLQGIVVIHRVGELTPGEMIVLVAVATDHRREAFEACQYLMDHLKTKAPFWKEERLQTGSHWVAAKTSDDEAVARWDQSSTTDFSR
jgi:molybdopterin synthase catalytic subunit